MSAGPEQHINVHLTGCNQQAIAVAWRDDGMAMGEAYPQRAMSDNSGEGEVGSFDIEVTFDDLEVWSYAS